MNVISSAKVATAMLFAVAAPAAAVTQISSPVTLGADQLGSTFRVNYNGFSSETLRPYLKAQSIFKLSAVSANLKSWTFSIIRYANMTTSPATSTRLAAFGFDATNAVITSATITGAGAFDKVRLGGSFPQLNPNIEVCFTPGTNCSSGGNGGLAIGAALTTGSFVLNLSHAVQKLTLDNFTVRYNAIVGPGTEPSGTGLATGNVFIEILPEPSTWLQMITGFGLIGAALRRRRTNIAVA